MTDEETKTTEEAPEEGASEPKKEEINVRFVGLEAILGFNVKEISPKMNQILTSWKRYYTNRGPKVSLYDRPLKMVSSIHFKDRATREAFFKGFLAVDLMLYCDTHQIKGVKVDPEHWKKQLLKNGYGPAPGLRIPYETVAAFGEVGLQYLAPDQEDIQLDERIRGLTEAWLSSKEEKLAFLAGWIIQGGIYNAYHSIEAQKAQIREKMKAQGQQEETKA